MLSVSSSEDSLPVGERRLESAASWVHECLEVLADEPWPHLGLLVGDDALGGRFEWLAELVAAAPRQQHREIVVVGSACEPRETPQHHVLVIFVTPVVLPVETVEAGGDEERRVVLSELKNTLDEREVLVRRLGQRYQRGRPAPRPGHRAGTIAGPPHGPAAP